VKDPIPLRAHLVVCLQGFRGEGYSPTFVAEMASLLGELRRDPERRIRLLDQPGRICRTCHHLRAGGCTLAGPDHEPHMRAQDQEVARRLGLAVNGVYPWRLIENRVAGALQGSDLPGLCTTCPWLELGYCAEGVEALRQARSGGVCGSGASGGVKAKDG
jgi:hypothetical protein